MTGRFAALAALALASAVAPARAASEDEALSAHARELATLDGAVPAVLVIEIREIVERAAGRGGSSVGSLSQRRRVEAFESELLTRTRGFACTSPRRPLPPAVLAAVRASGSAQQLPLAAADVPALSARVQRLIEAVPAANWCALRTLESVR